MRSLWFELLLVGVLDLVVHAHASNILFLLPLATKSHKNVHEPLYKALANRGHNVTVVSPIQPNSNYKNVHEIVPVRYDELMPGFPNPFERRKQGQFSSTMASNMHLLLPACERIYNVPEFLTLINQSFDLIVLNGFANDCFAGAIHKIGAPFIMLVSMAPPNFIVNNVGLHLPPSFVPFPLLPFSHEMNFFQRLVNLSVNVVVSWMIWWYSMLQDEVARKQLGQDIPSIGDIEKNVSMILTNSYFPLTYPRPLLPDVVEVGGMHCRPAKPLDEELQGFLNGATEGFIYFSMGSVVNTDLIPEEMRLKFLKVFRKLKHRVLWKWNAGTMDNLPENVRVSKWLPQQDILGHPKIRVFITHGGLLSTQEAVYHGVPVLGFPVFADQDLNMKQAHANGYGISLEILSFSAQELEESLKMLLNNPSYSTRAKELSSVIRDQIETPVERAVYWSEYVIRHKGAFHMRSAARELNFYQYHSIDVLAFLTLILIGLITFFVFVVRRCCRGTTGTHTTVVNPQSKKKVN